MAIRGYISHNGFTFVCPCGNTEEFISETATAAIKSAKQVGWRACVKSGWTCPDCYKMYAGEVSADDLAAQATEQTEGADFDAGD